MRRILRDLLKLSLAALALSHAIAGAQEVDIRQIRQNIELLSQVLEDALNLNETAGLFGITLGGVESTYLQEQGIVIEVRTPLANQRNRLSLASLTSSLQSLGARSNPFEAMRRSASAPEAEPSNDPTAEPADTFYREMMNRIAGVDFSLVVNTAIQQAANTARSLRSLGELDEDGYRQMQAEIEALRQRMQSGLTELRELEAEIREADGGQAALSEQLDALLAGIEPLREEALNFARELQTRNEEARQRYAESWRQDFVQLERDLYTALCDFGASLRALPGDEHISVILTGLGEDDGDNRRTDKVHVIGMAGIQQCQSGDIDVATLRRRSIEYSY